MASYKYVTTCTLVGQYKWSLLDQDVTYTDAFVELTIVMSIFLRKTVSDRDDIHSLHQRMAKALARLEQLLPVYWSTSTTYFILFGPEDMAEWGAFWAINMLKVLLFISDRNVHFKMKA